MLAAVQAARRLTTSTESIQAKWREHRTSGFQKSRYICRGNARQNSKVLQAGRPASAPYLTHVFSSYPVVILDQQLDEGDIVRHCRFVNLVPYRISSSGDHLSLRKLRRACTRLEVVKAFVCSASCEQKQVKGLAYSFTAGLFSISSQVQTKACSCMGT